MTIREKLFNIQQELKAPKNQFNSFGGYNYRSCEDILEAVKPLLEKNKCTLLLNDEMQNLGDRYYICASANLLDLESDASITNTAYAREEENKKGMDGSQITGASSSYARKYALNGLFLIDDVKDSDTTNHGVEYTLEDAKKYELTFGKHIGKTLEEINKEAPDYIEWLVKNSKDTMILAFIEKLFGKKKSDYEVSDNRLELMNEVVKLIDETETDLEAIKEHYSISSLIEATDEQLNEIHKRLVKTKELRGKANE